jgi:mannose-6-phosphate isomerase
MVWGGRRLATNLGKDLPDDQPYGESWELSDHPLHRSVVAQGPLAGTTLRQLMETRREELLGPGSSQSTFPILVKFLDCSDWLSVQVHPDEESVKKLWPGEGSKTEAWFVLHAEPGSRIYAGLNPGVGEREMRAALQAGTVAENLHSFEPKPGDCVFLPAGTVHAVGGGVLMAEVQQTSDATFRLFDWNRRDAQGNTRKLHIEEALASIHWDQGPVSPIHMSAPPETQISYDQTLVRCRFFQLDFMLRTDWLPLGYQESASIIIVLNGAGSLISERGETACSPGQVWLLSSASSALPRPGGHISAFLRPRPHISLLACMIPSAAACAETAPSL